MKIIISLLGIYLFFPFFGLFSYDGFGGQVTDEMVYLYAIHIFIEFSIVLMAFWFLHKNNSNLLYGYNFKKVSNITILLLLIVIFINLFIFGNYKILLGEIGRGEFRTTLHAGFIYIILSFYIPGTLIAINTFIYSSLPKIERKKNIFKLILVFILSMTVGFLTGFKSTAIFIAIMGLIGLDSILKLKNLLFIVIVLIIVMAISGYVFMNFDNFSQVFFYLFKRATAIAVDGTVGVYNNFPNGGDESYMIILYNFGNKLASAITGYKTNSLEYLKIDLGRHIAYITYPAQLKSEALSGAFNLTITNFGEAIYLLGKTYFPIYSFFIGLFIVSLLDLYQKSKLPLKITLTVYFITSVVIGGGRVTNIFAITTMVDLFIVYIVTSIILKYSRIR